MSLALPSRPTARLVIIGNEILAGKVLDTNSSFLLRRLRTLGVSCTGLVVVPDEVPRIARAVREAAASADFVFTTGGVGPTHDDCTMAGVAEAFGVPLVDDPTLLRLLHSRWKGPAVPARLRMARIPEGAEVLEGERFPQVRIANVYIFPGVPQLLERKFEQLASRFEGPRLACAAVTTRQGESALAPELEAVDALFPDVEIGSYPNWGSASRTVMLTLEGLERISVLAAVDALLERIDPAEILEVDRDYHPEASGEDQAPGA